MFTLVCSEGLKQLVSGGLALQQNTTILSQRDLFQYSDDTLHYSWYYKQFTIMDFII